MIREFYKDDETISAGLTGLLNWYDNAGYELLNQGATADDEGEAFQLEDTIRLVSLKFLETEVRFPKSGF